MAANDRPGAEAGDKGLTAGERLPPEAPALSVVIPAHNEGENLPSLIAEIRAALTGVTSYEIVIVDDCSGDASPSLLRRAAADYPEMRPFRHRHQSGQSAALATGVRMARATWVATLDGDGQNDPADIPKLLKMLRNVDDVEGLGLIAGHRARRKDTWLKRISSRIANQVRDWALRDSTPDTGCGLKLFRREIFLALPHFDHMHRFLPALFQRAGYRIVSVPVGHRPRSKGHSHYGVGNRLWVGIIDLLGVMWLQRRSRLPQGVENLAGRD